MAIYELSFKEHLVLADQRAANRAITNVHSRLNTRRDALVPEERRNNINIVKGLIKDCFVIGDVSKIAHGRRRELDIENTLRRSQIETPLFEIKQGILRLDETRQRDPNVFDKVLQSICGIGNTGRGSAGVVFVGVADKESDAARVTKLDGVQPKEIGTRWVVGIDREAKILGQTVERYYQMWRDEIDNSTLSQPLRSDVLSQLDLCPLDGRHILLITIPMQRTVSFYGGRVFARYGDQTVEASPEEIVGISARFAG